MTSSPPLRLRARFRLLTPAFTGGAQARLADEWQPLRATSMRGQWRYWLRAAITTLLRMPAGTPASHASAQRRIAEALRAAESQLFGSVRGEEGQGSRLLVGPVEWASGLQVQERPKPTRMGLRYLGYGLFEDPHRLPRAVVPTGPASADCFDLPLLILARSAREAEELEGVVEALLWLWALFGGLGARCRRGWGSIWPVAAVEAELPGRPLGWRELPVVLSPGGVQEELTRGYQAALRRIRAWLEGLLGPMGLGEALTEKGPRHPHIRSFAGLRSFQVLRTGETSALSALGQLGDAFVRFRSTLERSRSGSAPLPDYFEVKASLQGGPAPLPMRAAFGLPLHFSFRSLQGQRCTFAPLLPGEGRPSPGELQQRRLASPLIFRLLPLSGGGWAFALHDLEEKEEVPILLGLRLGQVGDLRAGRLQEVPTPGRRIKALLMDHLSRSFQGQP